MKVLLISSNTEQINMRTLPWGLGCVAAAARNAGHEVAMLDLQLEENPRAAIRRAVKDLGPEVIGISVRNIDDQNRQGPAFFLPDVKEVVDICREATGATIVLGGAGYSIFPQDALEFLGADMGIQGEGEKTFTALLERLESGADISDLPNLYLPGGKATGGREFAEDLGELPLPDDDMLAANYTPGPDLWIPLQTRRGCSFGCSYCSTSIIEGDEVRSRSPEPVVKYMAKQAEAGFRRFFFVDNNFNVPASHAREICRLLVEADLGVEWRCIFNPMQPDGELIREMVAAGCVEVSMGFESGCEKILQNMNKRFTLDDIRKSSELLGACGVRRMGFLLLGGPGETRESVEESLDFAESLDLEMMKVTVGIRVYPGTQLARTAAGENMVRPEDNLLSPRFYLTPGLEDWLRETLSKWKEKKPNWIFNI
ncbi:MAG: radical SAM protein [Planctomycetota bacterium]|nr:MAG: radical SAM protein [Planctomycetota bacterium]